LVIDFHATLQVAGPLHFRKAHFDLPSTIEEVDALSFWLTRKPHS